MSIRVNGESTSGVGIWKPYTPVLSGGYVAGGTFQYTYSNITASVASNGFTATYLYQATSATITTGMGVVISSMSDTDFNGTFRVEDHGTAYSNYRYFVVNLMGVSNTSSAPTGGTVNAYTSGTWELGNGTCVGKYSIIGDTVNFSGSLKIGSTTAVGDGYLYISLPVQSAAADANARYATLGSGRTNISNFKGNSVNYYYPMLCAQISATKFEPQILHVPSAGANYPISRVGLYSGNYTKTTNDLILFSGTYEAL